jgi:hypothetical protein
MKQNRNTLMKMIYNESFNQIATLIFKAVDLALSVGLVVLNILRAVDMQTQSLLLAWLVSHLSIWTPKKDREYESL